MVRKILDALLGRRRGWLLDCYIHIVHLRPNPAYPDRPAEMVQLYTGPDAGKRALEHLAMYRRDMFDPDTTTRYEVQRAFVVHVTGGRVVDVVQRPRLLPGTWQTGEH